MTPRNDNLNEHDRFRELAAIATSGALAINERAELNDHLRMCEACTEVYAQYRVLAGAGFPMLAASYEHREATSGWDETVLRRKLFVRIDEQHSPPVLVRSESPGLPLHKPILAVLGAALAACLIIGVWIGGWRLGRRSEDRTRIGETSEKSRIQGLLSAKNSVDVLLSMQSGKIAQLETESSTRLLEADKLRKRLQLAQDQLDQERASARAELEGVVAAKAASDEELDSVSRQRDRLSNELRSAEQAYQSVQMELASLRAERDRALLRLASLENRVNELVATNQDQERRLSNSQQYLSSDRDIRELMGARNLYIADVFDMDSSSRTRKPFGRVFYTRGKSLIFYAYDLDRQRTVRDASAFQVWGEKETTQGEQAKPLNLGILYLDSESNRRWILRFDNSQTLADIDAVFVTVEPRGGSAKPTGKPFLFAMLRKEANHP
jgi:hypothetical protein